MEQTHSIKEKLRQFFIILFPILVTQVSLFSMTFFDTMMSGQASPSDLAGVAIGSSLWVPVGTGLGGVFTAITPIVAHLIGGRRNYEVAHKVIQGVYLAIILAVCVILAGSLTLDWALSVMMLESGVREIARKYLGALAFGIPALFVYQILRSFMDALGKTRITMLIALLSLPINVLFNYILIFGKFGFPALGGVGAGIASALSYWVLILIAIWIIVRHPAFYAYHVFSKGYPISFPTWGEQLKIGIPIGFSIFFETSIFAAVTLLMSGFDTPTIAAHQGAMNFASMIYMVPLSFSIAMTILVGFEAGAHRFRDARLYSRLGIVSSLVMAMLTAIILLSFREQFAGLYSKEWKVIQLTQQFLIFALFFQFSDAVATPIQGILRGYKDVNVPFITSLLSYWVVALPVGYLLAHFSLLGAFGYWVGLIAGITCNAAALLRRLYLVQNKRIAGDYKALQSQ